jgi:hypothetical protein
MKGLLRNLLVISVAAVGSMPMQAKADSGGPCDGHGGMRTASAHPVGKSIDVTVTCADELRRGPYRFPVSGGAVPCADHGGVRAATARPGAGVIEIIIYCNDGQSEGPYVYEIR